ncbi:MAG TPA: SDR family oxidoreductase [Candidatus Avipropionibacterium avicola]|uniref:SDR family oxidoreductase n=1 Tax=Candidatus Avipropionibacterium avicola TaxID=2840701 RepID=A0A9D1KLC6_9ACTN|nr:SDR family oxidoreductase [Candidatus Avipropionibacterium avicola]
MSTALITGATSGIGAEFAAQLAARGDDLVLVARNAERLERTAQHLRDTHGVQVEVLVADLNDRSQTLKVAARLEDADRPIDRVVNNAGFGMHGRLLDEDLMAETDLAIEVMLASVILLGGAAARAMKARGHGSIINVSSTAGFIQLGTYSAVKAAVTAYSESLAVELRGSGVTVTALCPGWVRTEFHERAGINTSKIPAAAWIEVTRLVRDGLADADRGKVLSIPTPLWKVAIALTRILPRSVLRAVSGKIRSGRR